MGALVRVNITRGSRLNSGATIPIILNILTMEHAVSGWTSVGVRTSRRSSATSGPGRRRVTRLIAFLIMMDHTHPGIAAGPHTENSTETRVSIDGSPSTETRVVWPTGPN